MKFLKFCSPILVFTLVLVCCKKQDDVTGIAFKNIAYNAQLNLDKAEKFTEEKNADSAFYYYNAALTTYIKQKDSLRAGYAMLKMAHIQMARSDYFGSEATATEALKYLKNSAENDDYRTTVYNTLAISYKERNSYNDALHYYHEAGLLSKDSTVKCVITNNIANLYVQKEEYKKAFQILKQLIKSDVVLAHPATKSSVLNTLAGAYIAINNDSSVIYTQKSLEIREQSKDYVGMSSCYNQFAKYYSNKSKEKAILSARKAYDYATVANHPNNRIKALHFLIENIQDNNIYALTYIKLQDSLNKVRMKDKTQFAKIKYDSKIIQSENIRLKQQDELNRTQKSILVIITVFIIITALLIYFIQRLKHKKAKILEVYNAESRMSKKIHDELANDIFNVMSFAQTEDIFAPEKQDKLLQNLDNVYNKSRNISRENNAIQTGDSYGEVLKDMLSDYNSPQTRITMINYGSISWNSIAEHKKITVYRVLQELMVNMKKHSQAGLVALKFGTAGKKITIQYTDNGKGFSNSKLFYKNGLQNAENRILSIGGNITFENTTNGLKVIITFPV